jgi:ketosteroid isomerase-like protein
MSIESRTRAYYEYVDEEAYEDLFDLFADSIVYERPGQDEIRGMDAFRQFYLAERPLEEGSHTIHDVLVDGDTAAVRGTFSGIQDGSRVEFDFADFLVFDENRKVTHRYTYTDRDSI